MNRQDFTHQAEGWQHHDVNSRMGIEPKKVLIYHHISAERRIEKTGMGNDIEAQHD